ncbi:aspartate aminotransferase family protein [Bradyrhizobium ottawaense]|uniref:aspartate aminotransferase family protein n=1 Tax=Bradyrhizobium ottawaense TaxID=931866 RepID=UPI003F9F5754
MTKSPTNDECPVVEESEVVLASIGRPDLLTVADAKALSVARMTDLFKTHINPGQLQFMKLLGFHKVKVDHAEGMYYYGNDGRRILDFFGGFGSLALGHNHPRIIAARNKFQDEKRHEIAIAFMSQYAAVLAHNLAACSPDDLDMVFFGSSGSEAMEAALKLAERAMGPARPKIVYAENSFHGKTKGTLAVTDGKLYRAEFRLSDNTVRVPFGDIGAVASAFQSDPQIGVIVLETIQGGGGIIQASAEYWQKLRRLCDQHGVIWIADEVQCGFGRACRFYAFENYGVVPDITALAKSLGGGKSAMAAMIARRDIYMRAYGAAKTAMIHAPATFGGIGEACVTAIEAINVLYDENLIENSARTGAYLLDRLRALQTKYPKIIREVRGIGLMIGIEFQNFSQTLPAVLRPVIGMLDDKLKGSLSGFVGALLLRDYDVLVAFTEYNRNVIRLEPPLICTCDHVDAFIVALDSLLERGIISIVKDFVKSQVS